MYQSEWFTFVLAKLNNRIVGLGLDTLFRHCFHQIPDLLSRKNDNVLVVFYNRKSIFELLTNGVRVLLQVKMGAILVDGHVDNVMPLLVREFGDVLRIPVVTHGLSFAVGILI